jgi:hypothetical protein
MTKETMRRILWLTLLVALPVPYWVFESGWVPTMWLVELAGFCGAVLLSEGGQVPRIITALLGGQVAAYVLLLYLGARALARLVETFLPTSWQGPGVAAMVLVLLGTSLLPIYATPFVLGGAQVNLLQLFP